MYSLWTLIFLLPFPIFVLYTFILSLLLFHVSLVFICFQVSIGSGNSTEKHSFVSSLSEVSHLLEFSITS